MNRTFPLVVLLAFLALPSCRHAADMDSSSTVSPSGQPPAVQKRPAARDVHSYSNPSQIRVRHADLNWDVLFDRKILKGFAELLVERQGNTTGPLILDTRNLKIIRVQVSGDGFLYVPAKFAVGASDPVLGAPLTIEVPQQVQRVQIEYETSPDASGLQWMDPGQTAGKKHPFMFTQSQAIHARSWIPLQDSPEVRMTYSARVRVPPDLLAVMSAENNPDHLQRGEYTFAMNKPVPSYLIALAVGDLDFRSLGSRTGVYADPTVVDRAAAEFADTEKMIDATEELYGPYRWGRYDLLILPPSFPFGGMENPSLTFATPTILAGDKSLVALVAHELAHSWSGNLVTNATWRDFWLNEGFTVYLERRIQEAVYGVRRERMEAVLGKQDLDKDLADLPDADEILYINLEGRDPDDGFTDVPYEKGALFLRHLEETFGREVFDEFLRKYFDQFAFQSITTADFVRYLKTNLLEKHPKLAARIPLEEWIYQPGLPASAPLPVSEAFPEVEKQAQRWLGGEIEAGGLPAGDWSTQEWLHFLKSLPQQMDRARLSELDQAFALTRAGNSEVAHQWLLIAIRNGYEPAYERLEQYLLEIGRRKLIKPLYEELVKTSAGKERAMAIYRKARPGYHPIAITTLDPIVGWKN